MTKDEELLNIWMRTGRDLDGNYVSAMVFGRRAEGAQTAKFQTKGWVTIEGNHVLIEDGGEKNGGGAKLKLNLKPRITTPFGQKDTWHLEKSHRGVDIGGLPKGTPIPAVKGGKVARAGWEDPSNHKKGYGQRVTIQNQDGTRSTYGHMNDTPAVRPGYAVKQGDIVGYVGNTGHSSGDYLHYQVNAGGEPVPPSEDEINYLMDFFRSL
jgi:murein DD-endopeptidase MepM/ murein hydrolase activator NlpD